MHGGGPKKTFALALGFDPAVELGDGQALSLSGVNIGWADNLKIIGMHFAEDMASNPTAPTRLNKVATRNADIAAKAAKVTHASSDSLRITMWGSAIPVIFYGLTVCEPSAFLPSKSMRRHCIRWWA